MRKQDKHRVKKALIAVVVALVIIGLVAAYIPLLFPNPTGAGYSY